jgi:restriction system protein
VARRGFFAELQHQARVAAREAEREERAAERAHKAAVRQAEQARKAEQRAQAQLARAAEADRKRLAKQAREAHIAAMGAEVERRNLELASIYEEIDSLLAATLDVDDYVDLDTLRATVDHPPFERTDLETPVAAPDPIPDMLEPVGTPPAPPKGIRALFGKKKHAEAVAEAEEAHAEAIAAWREEQAQLPLRRKAAADEHLRAEAHRVAALEAERARYAAECSAREAEAAEHNKTVDELVANLGYGTVDAVQEYVSIVLSNSVYPPHFPAAHKFAFDAATAELRLHVLVPGPDTVPQIKAYKYRKSSDEITETSLSQKACKDRYSGAVHEVALRSLHEVFEADRRGLIKTISLEVGTETIDPATGRETYVPFVATGAERDSFLEYDLSGVVPAATLADLGAALSKNPFGLLAADAAGIRRS